MSRASPATETGGVSVVILQRGNSLQDTGQAAHQAGAQILQVGVQEGAEGDLPLFYLVSVFLIGHLFFNLLLPNSCRYKCS